MESHWYGGRMMVSEPDDGDAHVVVFTSEGADIDGPTVGSIRAAYTHNIGIKYDGAVHPAISVTEIWRGRTTKRVRAQKSLACGRWGCPADMTIESGIEAVAGLGRGVELRMNAAPGRIRVDQPTYSFTTAIVPRGNVLELSYGGPDAPVHTIERIGDSVQALAAALGEIANCHQGQWGKIPYGMSVSRTVRVPKDM